MHHIDMSTPNRLLFAPNNPSLLPPNHPPHAPRPTPNAPPHPHCAPHKELQPHHGAHARTHNQHARRPRSKRDEREEREGGEEHAQRGDARGERKEEVRRKDIAGANLQGRGEGRTDGRTRTKGGGGLTQKTCTSAQLYRRRSHASHAMPRPEAMLDAEMAERACESTVNIESGDMERTVVFTAARATSCVGGPKSALDMRVGRGGEHTRPPM
jgi:hypothetical protein